MHDTERGIFELRRGRPVVVIGRGDRGSDVLHGTGVEPGVDRLIAAAEGLTESTLALLRTVSNGPVLVVITEHRAEVLGISRAEAPIRGQGPRPGAVALQLPAGATPEDVLRLCCAPDVPLPPGLHSRPAVAEEAAALSLARTGHLLPAVLVADLTSPHPQPIRHGLTSGRFLVIRSGRVGGEAAQTVVRVSEAAVPLRDAEDARFVMFREERGLLEHVAVLIGPSGSWPDPVPVRLHSACLTGDLFGSLKCDCGEQLRGSLCHFRQEGGGVLLYLAHEGRGIGLANKLRAYALQDGGLDTVDADCALGFGPDERTYEAALHMLRDLGVTRVRLLTNNPEKLRAVQLGGVEVLERRPLHGTLNRHNLPYVRAKVQRAGHWLTEMLSGAPGTGA